MFSLSIVNVEATFCILSVYHLSWGDINHYWCLVARINTRPCGSRIVSFPFLQAHIHIYRKVELLIFPCRTTSTYPKNGRISSLLFPLRPHTHTHTHTQKKHTHTVRRVGFETMTKVE